MSRLRIATRASELALWQARHVAEQLQRLHPELDVDLVDVTTQGDVDQTQPLRELGGTGVFTKEVQRAVLDGRADLAVHSLKDLPTQVAEPDLVLAAVPVREIRWDALVLPQNSARKISPESPWESFPPAARIGSGSPRRQAQVRAVRPDLQLAEIRGNLNTRLRKLDDGEYDALILAMAGMLRLGWDARISCPLTPPVMYPAVSQGALGLECRRADAQTLRWLEPLNDPDAVLTTRAERALLAGLQAGCHAPVGVAAQTVDDQLELTAVVLSPDGTQRMEDSARVNLPPTEDRSETATAAAALGTALAERLLSSGAADLIAAAESEA